MVMSCPRCSALVLAAATVTGNRVLLNPIPRNEGRWALRTPEDATFMGSEGRYVNHRLECK